MPDRNAGGIERPVDYPHTSTLGLMKCDTLPLSSTKLSIVVASHSDA